LRVSDGKMAKKLTARIFGKKIYHFPAVDSTNKIAISLAEEGEREGTVIVADQQARGEGRRGRNWFSPPGGLWFSFILRPDSFLSETPIYPLIAASGIVESIKKIYSCFSYIIWPNDVFLKGKKVSGVMCRAKVAKNKVKFAIIGVGVNLNVEFFPSSLENLATSLFLETGKRVDCFYFLECFLKLFEDIYFSFTRSLNKEKTFFKKNPVKVFFSDFGNGKGMYLKGIDQYGRLIFEEKYTEKEFVVEPADFSIVSYF